MSEDKKDNFMDGVYGLIILIAIWQGLGWYNDWKFTPYEIYKSFTHEPTPEEIAERKVKEKEKEIEKQRKKENEKSDFISSLGKNVQNIENLDYKELALKHITETELQNDETEKRLMDKYIRVRGKVSDVDSKGDEYGIPEFMIQLLEGKELYGTVIDGLYLTANCYATNENEKNKITNTSIGSELTIVGKVASYGDMGGLILNYCTVE